MQRTSKAHVTKQALMSLKQMVILTPGTTGISEIRNHSETSGIREGKLKPRTASIKPDRGAELLEH